MLSVLASKNLTGAIDRHPGKSTDYDFAYNQSMKAGQEVSLTMPYSLESYPFKNGLHPVFQMNLPEGRLRESIERDFRKRTMNFDDLTLLEIVGCSQIGRLRFSNNMDAINDIPLQSVHELISYDGTEDLLRDLLEKFADYSGISGVQPKVLIRDADGENSNHENDRITVKGATHIVKGWDKSEYPHLAANEFFCLKAAQRSGLTVPSVKLSENNRFLIVDRFDLTADGQYIGFEDFCSLNGVGTQDKYNSNYEKLAKRICDYVSPEFRGESLETFFRSLALSCVVKNGDAHLKNFGVLYEATDKPVKLAPTFDIVTTTPYIKNDSLALMLDGSKRFPNAKKLLKFAKLHCNLQPERASGILEEIAEAALKTMHDVRQHIKDYPDFEKVGDAMEKAWGDGIMMSCAIDSRVISLPKNGPVKVGVVDVVADGEYIGRVSDLVGSVVTQKTGREAESVVRHDAKKLSRLPVVGEIVEIKYGADGLGRVSEREVGKDRGR